MSNITNYSFLFQSMFGGTKTSWGTGSTLPGVFLFSQLNSSSIQSQLKAAGIDTSSKQYKAVIQQMAKDGCTGSMFTNVQSIKNLMKNYNSRGEWVDPDTGLTGLLVTDETGDSYKKIIDVPERSKDKMFEAVKNNFLNNNGMGDGKGKTEIYMDMYKQMKSDDRLSAGWTLGQYHKAYAQAFKSAIKTVDPTWDYGKAIPSGVLDGITRESVESQLVKSGNTFVKKPSSGSTLDIQI
ncbi:hypothetical protein D7V94_22580 [Parablautia intestinalis]|uniref:Uncharacterized protein n=1 Tax=Parablautia intestinalis TaxID=2320100 RepID=A0A3A9AKK5_9FIRM|nr:DUF3879 family protein [Parablautia intestinalis]RKI86835.1 hypothetical protein D7V94_22580 [Parablautia intestinalis]